VLLMRYLQATVCKQGRQGCALHSIEVSAIALQQDHTDLKLLFSKKKN
jgi:hypothetical protein